MTNTYLLDQFTTANIYYKSIAEWIIRAHNSLFVQHQKMVKWLPATIDAILIGQLAPVLASFGSVAMEW